MLAAASRIHQAVTFQAVEFAKQAQYLREQGHDIISLGIGEPDFTAPPIVIDTLHKVASAGLSGYSPALGITPLRKHIADYYNNTFGTNICYEQIIITTGASGALSLACLSLLNPGDEILMPDPYYPANFNFILAAGASTRLIPCTPEERYQLSADKIAQHWDEKTKGVLIASPSNPTGTSVTPDELQKIFSLVKSKGGFVILDEIYLGLSYDGAVQSGLVFDKDIIVINSFSKFFNMTGWRLGWMIAPTYFVPHIEKLTSSLNICPPTLAQHAAIACFSDEAMAIYHERKQAFKERRDYLLKALEHLKLVVPVKPDGAFYIYADISYYSHDSMDFCQRLLQETGIAIIPGLDFGPTGAKQMIRISYATAIDRLKEAIARLEIFLPTLLK
ncbi:pyridoxal phosphate-dependent aminotransferase [Pelistega sp. NLN82]|uniref:Aminotransferase n=1 Tax=Pelistega ratti TaxID=2652177 RepID=A0A6L9Y4P3_9BURK|nr:pyridoxal phosphate-dependent aminotransferase [Pelistega ratti]NEN74758.1 pyridoxal phosphate-dependent aminotransferase [Pelistega ratti]